MQTSDENKEKHQLWDYYLMQYQILQTNIMRIIWQTVRRIPNEILGIKGLTPLTSTSDHGRISPYDIVTISSREVMRIKKNVN